VLDDTNIIVMSDHSTDNVEHNITNDLAAALESTGIPYENAVVDMGPFGRETKVVYNLSSAAAQIYLRLPLTEEEETRLLTALRGITGVAAVYDRAQLDVLNTPENLGDYVVDCAVGYAFSSSYADHGSRAQQQTVGIYYGPDIRAGLQYTTQSENVDAVATILYLNDLTIPDTVDGDILYDIMIPQTEE
ncbi:MAG: hypothetical protein J6I64_00280, partial [Lachnospiraceae bacterium]|nr:hypothetical protein [Lachnospiraceae bacterium]